MRIGRRALFFALAGLAWFGARARAGSELQLQVVAESVPVRAGPGGSFRQVGRVGAGETFTVLDTTADHAWYRIELARGVSGWVFAEMVMPYRVVESGAWERTSGWLQRNLLGHGRFHEGKLCLSVQAGSLGSDGLFALALGWLATDNTMFELKLGQAAGDFGGVFSSRLEMLILLGPWRPLVPFVAVGGGYARFSPHRNVDVFASGSHALASAGGGMFLQLRAGITLRIDARQVLLYSANGHWTARAISGGVMLVF